MLTQNESLREPLHILSLEASNIKKLTAIHITPKGNVVTLTGANGAGKSSVLDAIWYALAGKEAICDQPIRVGAASAKTVLHIGNGSGKVAFVATRKLSATGTSIVLEDADGRPQTSPQTILDKLIGNLTFDPIEFVRMNGREQLETLRKLVGLDFTAQDVQRKLLYDDRTQVNRDKDRTAAQLAALPFDPSAPKEKVSVATLVGLLDGIEATNLSNAQSRAAKARAVASVETTQRTVLAAEQMVAEAQRRLEQATQAEKSALHAADQAGMDCEGRIDSDTTPIKQQIQQAGAVNEAVERNARNAALRKEVYYHETASQKLTAKIEAIDKAKADALAAAKFPLPELSFNENVVLLNKLPFAQASTAEQLRASVAVGMALNPTLRVVFIRDGSVIDDAGLALVAQLADENDYQVWLETVRSNDPTAVVIEDGHVKEAAKA
jgi:ABC-type cobalamin/Fe3+-siderophores transport system ATPase subunit